jgi:hypothetical protein
MDTLLEIFFLPPMAIARLGSGSTPVSSFRWSESATPLDAPSTIIEPAVSLAVEADGTITPFMPKSIVFKDADGSIRPVAPFFELWARLQSVADGSIRETPMTLALLSGLKVSLGDLRYEITAANRKAERRTGIASCSFVAHNVVQGNDHEEHELLAFSPHTSGQEPLVYQEQPIPLGTFQVIRPRERQISVGIDHSSVDCSITRVRFTPPKGLVYGPPAAATGPAPEVQPGVYEAAATQFGRIHEVVPPERRILNGNTEWSRYIMMNGQYEDPPPQDGYDGAAVGNFQSWACVDDTSDALIQATLAVDGRLYRAVARVLTGPPDFAPDRRPVYSLADDIADRELPPIEVSEGTFTETKFEILDLFHRAFETASLFNLDAIRARALQENRVRLAQHSGPPGKDVPKAGDDSMTSEDEPFVDKLPILAPLKPSPSSRFTKGVPNNQLPYTTVVSFVHGPLTDEAVLLDLLQRRGSFVERMVRPAYARVGQLPDVPSRDPNPNFRDPRVFRDQLHDMRMPPYMRDANLQPLSISRRQYQALKDFIALLSKQNKERVCEREMASKTGGPKNAK